MKCPYCKSAKTKVVDKRPTPSGDATRRRRECLKCKKRFSTYERVEVIDLSVIKKDGSLQAYDRAKLLRGVLSACEKTPVSRDKIEKLVDDVEARLRKRSKNEVESKFIGELVMDRLKKIDKVAYIRFASVYREFEDPKEFQKEVGKLLKK